MRNKNTILNYRDMVDRAMRMVVKEILEHIEQNGVPMSHQIYVTFNTQYPGVSIDDDLLEQYPEEMTIILQHQFWDLEILADYFCVTLSFSGEKKTLLVPFNSITSFADPKDHFGLQFQYRDPDKDIAKTEIEWQNRDNKQIGATSDDIEYISSDDGGEHSIAISDDGSSSANSKDSKNSSTTDQSKKSDDNKVVTLDSFRKNKKPKK